ncbi:MAG: SRP-less Sec system protein [Leptospira sp.]|nr:SRP-less Sec system protein [Leptospira sp.]
MKTIISILTFFFVFIGEVWAQDNLDFLDKVNDKPKTSTTTTTTQVKSKDESTTSTKKSLATQTTKKKKSKKKNQNSLTNANQITPTTNLNTTTNTLTPQTNPVESKPVVIQEPQVKQEEEVVMKGLWIEPEVVVEPDGLPGFASDLSFGRSQTGEETKSGTSQATATSKPLFSFSEFFDKYKKAMMILGIIILFAFYRLRLAKPSSSSRPYRR